MFYFVVLRSPPTLSFGPPKALSLPEYDCVVVPVIRGPFVFTSLLQRRVNQPPPTLASTWHDELTSRNARHLNSGSSFPFPLLPFNFSRPNRSRARGCFPVNSLFTVSLIEEFRGLFAVSGPLPSLRGEGLSFGFPLFLLPVPLGCLAKASLGSLTSFFLYKLTLLIVDCVQFNSFPPQCLFFYNISSLAVSCFFHRKMVVFLFSAGLRPSEVWNVFYLLWIVAACARPVPPLIRWVSVTTPKLGFPDYKVELTD